MKLFGRTGGYYLFWAGCIYIIGGLVNAYFKLVDPTLLSVAWVLCLIVPLTIKPVADYFNMSTVWDQLKPRNYTMDETPKDNVYSLPAPKLVPPSVPEVDASASPAYQIGVTEDGRVTLRLGNGHQWSQISMNDTAVDTLIRMLEAAKET